MTIIAIILTLTNIFFFIKWIRTRKFLRALRPYYELMYNYDNSHKLTFAVISPVTAVRPRSEYSGFTCRVYFTDYEQAESERLRIIDQNEKQCSPTLKNKI